MHEPWSYLALPPLRRQLGLYVVLLGVITGIAALYGLIFQPTKESLSDHATTLFLLAVGVPLLLALSPFVWIVLRRAGAYPALFAVQADAAIEKDARAVRDTLLRRLLAGLSGRRLVTIAGVLKDGASLRLVLEASSGLHIGSEILCIQVSTGDPLGHFNVSSNGSGRFVASEVQVLDPLWWGAVHQRADQGYLAAPDDTMAVIIVREGAAS